MRMVAISTMTTREIERASDEDEESTEVRKTGIVLQTTTSCCVTEITVVGRLERYADCGAVESA